MLNLKIKIRKALISEAKEIANLGIKLNLHHRNIDSKYYALDKNVKPVITKFFKKKIRDRNSILLVATSKNKIIGYALGFVKNYPPVRKTKKHGYVSDVFVDKNYREKGISREFIEELMRWFKRKKLKYMELNVDSRNKLGLKAWKDVGFREIPKQMIKKI